MNEKQKDKGLMKAVKEQPQFRLTSNFTFRTMQKVEEAILLREKKQERKMLLATIAASLFLIISGSIGLYIYFGKCRMVMCISITYWNICIPYTIFHNEP